MSVHAEDKDVSMEPLDLAGLRAARIAYYGGAPLEVSRGRSRSPRPEARSPSPEMVNLVSDEPEA